MNVYFVTAFIGIASLFYMVSFAFMTHDIMNGSSLKMKRALEAKKLKECEPSILDYVYVKESCQKRLDERLNPLKSSKNS